MAYPLPEAAHRAGVLGGGSGSAVAPKLRAKADLVIANAAECVPLAASDLAVLEAQPEQVLRAFHEVLAALDARAGVLAISERATRARDAVLRELPKFSGITVVPVRDFYPAGDASVLTGEVLGHAAPRRDPHSVTVLNVRTLADLAAAAGGTPVTHRDVTVTGAVRSPGVFRLPIGTAVRSAVAAAGDALDGDWIALAGNPMTALPVDGAHSLAKKDSLVVVLAKGHPLARARALDDATRRSRTMAGCDGCGACADLCPRTAGDASLRPDLVVRALLHGQGGRAEWLDAARACSGCGLCETYACPPGLSPHLLLRDAGAAFAALQPAAHPFAAIAQRPGPSLDGRRVPRAALTERLGLASFAAPSFHPEPVVLRSAKVPLAGARAVVREGERVRAGDLLAEAAGGSVRQHAPFAGRVFAVTSDAVMLDGGAPAAELERLAPIAAARSRA